MLILDEQPCTLCACSDLQCAVVWYLPLIHVHVPTCTLLSGTGI